MAKPDAATLEVLFGQPPEVAIKYLQEKQLAPTKAWHEMRDNAHNYAFTVANLAKVDILADIKKSLEDAVKNGTPMAQWRNELTPKLQAKGWYGKDKDGKEQATPWRMETIYRTNLQSAYMAGRRHEMLQATDTHPYWRYVAVMDRLTRPAHRALNGRVMRADDPAWDTVFPPCGFNCRCRVSPMTQGAVSRGNYTVESSEGNLTTDVVGLSGGESANITVLKLPSMEIPFKVDAGFNSAPNYGATGLLVKKTQPDITQISKIWPTFSPASASVDDFVALGKQRFDDLFSLQVTETQTIKQLLDSEKLIDYVAHHAKLNQWIVRELQRTRQASSIDVIVQAGAQAKKIMKKATKGYPASWIKSANEYGSLTLKFSSRERGFAYTTTRDQFIRLPKFGQILAKKGDGFILFDKHDTAVHEFAHRVQSVRPDIDELFQQEHRTRTANDPITQLPQQPRGEVGKQDGYYNSYMGRQYKEYVGREALEVMTMAIQPVLGQDDYSASYLFKMYHKDRRMLELVLGILFHCE